MTATRMAMALGLLAGIGGTAIAQETAGQAGEPVAPCDGRTVSFARMQWPSAELLAEIHSRIVAREFGCQVSIVAGDLTTTGSSMATGGEPAVAPELWVGRIADIWNQGVAAQAVSTAGDSFSDGALESWYVPDYVLEADWTLVSAAAIGASPVFGGSGAPPPEPVTAPAQEVVELAPPDPAIVDLPAPQPDIPAVELPVPLVGAPRFISCPADWACAVVNRNLLAAHGLAERFEIVEPANRFEMDGLIAEAVSRREPFVAYYWAPNAILDQFEFASLDMGVFDAEAMRCLASRNCAEPRPSAFVPEPVKIALVDWLVRAEPGIADYFSRASMPIGEMNALIGALNVPGATAAEVATAFVETRQDVWQAWVAPPND